MYIIRRRRATDPTAGHREPPLGAPDTLCVPIDDNVRRALATPATLTRITSLKRQTSTERKKPAVDDTSIF